MKKLLMITALAMVASAPVMAEGYGKGPGRHRNPERKLEMMFKRHDTNKDGVIAKDEFLKGAEERFEKIDLDSDGKVTKEEAKKHAEEMREKFKKMREERNASSLDEE